MKSFKQYLSESPQECGLRYGKILFGEMIKKEKDTPEEKRLYDFMVKWTEGKDNIRSKEFVDALKKLEKCKTVFKKELEPSKSVMYRFIGFNGIKHTYKDTFFPKRMENLDIDVSIEGEEWILTGGYDDIIRENTSEKIWLGFEEEYTPANEVESWTDNWKTYISGYKQYGYVWKSPIIKNEVIFDSKFLESLRENTPSVRGFVGEDEIIRISKKPIKGTAYIDAQYMGWTTILRDAIRKVDDKYTYNDTIYLNHLDLRSGDMYFSADPSKRI